VPGSPFDRLPDLYGLLDDVAAKAQEVRPPTAEGLSKAQELSLGLFVSTFEVFLGMRALLRERLAEEARMLSRSLLDDTARLIWLATASEDLDTRVLSYAFTSIEFEADLYRAARDNGYDWAEAALDELEKERAVATDEAARLGVELKKIPPPRSMLHSLKQPELYYWHVRASQAIHSTVVGLSGRFAAHPDDDQRFAIPLMGSVAEVLRIGAMSIQAFSLAMIAADDLLAWGRRDELIEYRERMMRLSAGLLG
jgi:hypothetical protein